MAGHLYAHATTGSRRIVAIGQLLARFTEAAARRDLGEDDLPAIRRHDLRHSHASLLLAAGVPVKEVSERLGHASPVITLGVYAHVIPSMTQSAARWTELMSDRVVDKL
jgi:integrase